MPASTTDATTGSLVETIDYLGGFYRDLAPVHLSYVCTINGETGPDPTTPFSYCELGCGIGETTASLAAAYPHGQFYGIDLSASHIERAQSLADAAGLTNLRFYAANIAAFDADALPDLDYVTLHGLYAWVAPDVQAAIRAFLQRKLKPDGVAFVSYNAMPGWGSVAPLRHYFVEHAATGADQPLTRTTETVNQLIELRNAGSPYFRDNPIAAQVLTRLASADPRYTVHEYLGPYWQPYYFTEVHDEMAACGLRFVANADVIDSLLEHSVAPDFVARLRALSDIREREDLRDFIQNRFFRRDIYIRPGRPAPTAPAAAPFGSLLFGLVADPIQIPRNMDIPDSPGLTFEGAWFDRVKERLGYRVLTFDELRADHLLSGVDPDQLATGIKLMTAGGFCGPCIRRETEPPRGPTDRIAVVPRLNRVLLERHDWSASPLTLISPVLGNGVTLNQLETVFLLSLQLDHPLSWVWDRIQEKGMVLQSEKTKRAMTERASGIDALEVAMQHFLRYRLPKLAYLGMVAPAE